jgi:DNA processing protein
MKYCLWLHMIEGYGAMTAAKMLECGYSAEDVFHMKREELESFPFLKRNIKEKILLAQREKDPDELLEKLTKKEIHFYSLEKGVYPEKLRRLNDAPYGLFCKGALPDERRFTVGVVGARNCSSYGRAIAKEIGEELGGNGVQVISGLARGVDSYAQRGTVAAGGKSFAILGCGVNICYPKENYELFYDIENNGGIISEYPPDTEPRAPHFPLRNRIISGLSDCTIVVEARKKSGSLITAEYALEQGREVYAVPGQIRSSLSEGCHKLIHQGAGIYYSSSEFLKDMSLDFEQHRIHSEEHNLEKEEKLVYSSITLLPKSSMEIQEESGLERREVLRILLNLQLKNMILELGKGRYIRIRT